MPGTLNGQVSVSDWTETFAVVARLAAPDPFPLFGRIRSMAGSQRLLLFGHAAVDRFVLQRLPSPFGNRSLSSRSDQKPHLRAAGKSIVDIQLLATRIAYKHNLGCSACSSVCYVRLTLRSTCSECP